MADAFAVGYVQGTTTFYKDSSAQFKLLWVIPDYIKLKPQLETTQFLTFKEPISIISGKFSCQAELQRYWWEKYSRICLRNTCSSEMWIRCQASVLDVNLKKQKTRTFDEKLQSNGSIWNDEWFSQDYIEKNKDTVLVNGSLQVVVQGTVYTSDPVIKRANVLKDSIPSMDIVSFDQSDELSDAILSVGEEKFHVNKSVLSRRSSVFRELFMNQTQNILVLSDVSAPVFRQVLQYIYTDTLTTEIHTMLPEIFTVAKKYNLDYLCGVCENEIVETTSMSKAVEYLLIADIIEATKVKKCLPGICEKKMVESVSVSNAVEYLQLADKINSTNAKKVLIKFITENKSNIVKEESWKVYRSNPGDSSGLLLEVLDALMEL